MALPGLGLFGRRRHPPQAYSMARRPGFGLWLKHTWLDILTMAILGAVGLGVRPPPSLCFLISTTIIFCTAPFPLVSQS